LEGLEAVNINWVIPLIENTVKDLNGTSAKVLGTMVGIGGAVETAVKGIGNAFAHPVETAKGIGKIISQSPTQNAVDYGISLAEKYGNSGSDAFSNYAVGAHLFTDIAMALSPMKEVLQTGVKNFNFAIERINLPKRLARVIEEKYSGSPTLGKAGISGVFVTDAI